MSFKQFVLGYKQSFGSSHEEPLKFCGIYVKHILTWRHEVSNRFNFDKYKKWRPLSVC